VIEVLRQIKKTHELQTVVGHGQTCGSMCVFIYLQGQKRVGALSSTWLFHEVSHTDPVSKKIDRLDRPHWERLVEKYFRPAGVSDPWIAHMKPYTVTSDYWQTGADLVNAKSGIIHEALGNQMPRIVAPRGRPEEIARRNEERPRRHAEPRHTDPPTSPRAPAPEEANPEKRDATARQSNDCSVEFAGTTIAFPCHDLRAGHIAEYAR
jgi:hypothetical protein